MVASGPPPKFVNVLLTPTYKQPISKKRVSAGDLTLYYFLISAGLFLFASSLVILGLIDSEAKNILQWLPEKLQTTPTLSYCNGMAGLVYTAIGVICAKMESRMSFWSLAGLILIFLTHLGILASILNHIS